MRHQQKGFKLGRTSAHRKATLAALSSALIRHKRITTTLTKAKALQIFVEPLINRAKEDTTHNRRQVFRRLQDKEAIKELFGDVSTRIGERSGGYTRVVRLGQRHGDGAQMAVIELVDYNDVAPESRGGKARRRTRRSRRGRAAAAPAAAAAATATEEALPVDESADVENGEIGAAVEGTASQGDEDQEEGAVDEQTAVADQEEGAADEQAAVADDEEGAADEQAAVAEDEEREDAVPDAKAETDEDVAGAIEIVDSEELDEEAAVESEPAQDVAPADDEVTIKDDDDNAAAADEAAAEEPSDKVKAAAEAAEEEAVEGGAPDDVESRTADESAEQEAGESDEGEEDSPKK
jgi:large subunit ribosomal protein L17